MEQRRLRLLALFGLDRFDHAAHGKQRVETRRLQLRQPKRPISNLVRLCERRLVQADLGLFSLAFDGEIDGAIAARKLLLAKAARPDLERFEARGEPQAKIEIAAVDAARFPRPARVPVHAFGAGKAGHAFQGHGGSRALPEGSLLGRTYSRVGKRFGSEAMLSASDCGVVFGTASPLAPAAGGDVSRGRRRALRCAGESLRIGKGSRHVSGDAGTGGRTGLGRGQSGSRRSGGVLGRRHGSGRFSLTGRRRSRRLGGSLLRFLGPDLTLDLTPLHDILIVLFERGREDMTACCRRRRNKGLSSWQASAPPRSLRAPGRRSASEVTH